MEVGLRFLYHFKDCDCQIAGNHIITSSECFSNCGCSNPQCKKRSYKIVKESDFCILRYMVLKRDGHEWAALVCKMRDGTRFGAHVFVLKEHRLNEDSHSFFEFVADDLHVKRSTDIGGIPQCYKFDPDSLRRYPRRKNRGKKDY